MENSTRAMWGHGQVEASAANPRSQDVGGAVLTPRRGHVIVAFVLAVTLGCARGPERFEAPAFKPDEAAVKAIELYDTNGDGKVADKELDAVPSLKKSAASIDTDGDGALSKDEIGARIGQIVRDRVGIIQVSCVVVSRGQPVPNVEIRFIPEKFLEGVIGPAVGVTGASGSGIAIMKSDDGYADGVQPGFYRVELSRKVNGRETMPARFNERTTLGQEISFDSEELRMGILRFEIN